MGRAGRHLDIVDPRGGGRILRLSFHAGRRIVVVSQWREGVCVATTPVGLEHLARLVGFLVGALAEAATPDPGAAPRPRERAPHLAALIRRWLATGTAQVIALPAWRGRHRPERRAS